MIDSLISKYKKIPTPARASLWFAICSFVANGVTLFTTPIFTRLLATSEYGAVSIYNTWTSIISIILSLNLAAGVYVRGLVKYEEDKENFTNSLYSVFLLNYLVISALFCIFINPFSNLIELEKRYIYIMMADILFTTSFNFWAARQRVEYKYRLLITVTLTNVVIKPTIGIILVLNSTDKVFAYISSLIIADALVYGFFFFRAVYFSIKNFSYQYWAYALRYNIPLVPHYLSNIVLKQSDRLMIKKIVGLHEAGIYSLAYSLSQVMLIVNTAITNSFNPWIYSKLKRQKYDEIKRISTLLVLFVFSINAVVILLAPEVLIIFAPKQYYDAVWIIPPVTASVFFMFIYNLFSNVEFYFEKTKWMTIATLSGAILNIILNAIFIPKFGYLAAGYTTLFCYICFAIFHFIVMSIILKANKVRDGVYNLRAILLIGILMCAVSFISLLLYKYRILRMVVLAVIAIMVLIFRKKLIELVSSLYKETRKSKEGETN